MGEDEDNLVINPPIVVPPDVFARLQIDFTLSEEPALSNVPTAWIAKVEFLEGRRVVGSTDLFCVINGVLAY